MRCQCRKIISFPTNTLLIKHELKVYLYNQLRPLKTCIVVTTLEVQVVCTEVCDVTA